MNKGKALTPRLRFPEFRDAAGWESRQLVDVCSKITQGGTPDTSTPEYWGGAINWMTPAEMGKTESPFIAATNRTITEQGLRDCSSDLLPVNSVILSVRAPIGHLAINTAPMAINQGCKGLIAGKSLDFYFLYCSLVGSKTRLIDLGAGNTFKELSGTALKRFEIPIPKPAEQQKIAECLSSVDELVAAQARKLDALKTHKKGLMQQIFPREGETQPRLRFPEFQNAGEWEEKQVGEVFKVTRGEVLSMTLVQDEKTSEARYPVYSSQTKNNGLSGYYSDFLYEDAITWTTDGANAGDVNYRSGKFYCTNVCGVLINTDDYANPCVAALINSVSRSHVSYVGNPKLMNGVMAKISIPFPKVEEQKRISDCLTSLDDLIAAQTQKLNALKTHKKGLMQQLFPSSDEVEA